MPDPTPATDARRLAALLDGRLDGAERQRLLGELAASDEALDVYGDAAAVLAELEREGVVVATAGEGGAAADGIAVGGATAAADGRVPTAVPTQGAPAVSISVVSIDEARARRRAPTPRWRVPRWAALAAGIAVVVAAPALWWQARSAGEAGRVTSYAALLAPETRAVGLPPGWDGTPWRVTRGAGDPLTPEARAVRIGARLTDLELAAAARDTGAVRLIAAEVAALLDEVPGAGAVAAAYRALGTPAAADAAKLASAQRDAALVAGEESVALGAWLEAARVATARRDAAFFRTGESRAALENVRGSATEQRPAVDRTAEFMSREPPAWEQLGTALAALLRAHAG